MVVVLLLVWGQPPGSRHQASGFRLQAQVMEIPDAVMWFQRKRGP